MLSTRITSIRRAPTVAARFVRQYSESRDGATAKSREFSKKEQAHENQYAKEHEQEQLKKLRAQINAKKAELDRLQQEHEAIAEKK